jgi:hypothetical protein
MKFLSDIEIKTIIRETEFKMYDRNEDGTDVSRPADAAEALVIKNLIYGAITNIKWHQNSDFDKVAQISIDQAEFIFDLFYPKSNGYLTLYNPAWEICAKCMKGDDCES